MSGSSQNGWAFLSIFATITLFSLYTPVLRAEFYDPDKADEEARQRYIERFSIFTQDKNVSGKATKPDGTPIDSGPQKSRFNQDDKGLFQSDLTYHDYSYDVSEELDKTDEKGEKKTRKLYGFISDHGAVKEGGGSSELERVVYEFHDKYSKEEEKKDPKKPAPDEKPGVEYKSVFEVTQKEIKKSGEEDQSSKTEPEKVAKWTLRDDVAEAVKNVGKNSFESIDEASKDAEGKGDPKAGNDLGMLYEAVSRASLQMWDSTLTNLAQRRVNRAILPEGPFERIRLNEAMADCQKWEQQASSAIADIEDPNDRKDAEERIQTMKKECEEVAQTTYKSVMPRYEVDKDGNEKLTEKGTEPEDARERDLRTQLEVMAKAGISANDVPSNWQYTKEEESAPVTLSYDESAAPKDTENLTIAEQLQPFNEEIQRAAEDYAEVQKLIPDFKLPTTPEKILQSQIQPGTKSLMELNQVPPQIREEFNASEEATPPPPNPIADNYNALIQ